MGYYSVREVGEKQWITWSIKSEGGVTGPVKPVHMVFTDDEFSFKVLLKTSCNATRCARSSATVTTMSSCTLVMLYCC